MTCETTQDEFKCQCKTGYIEQKDGSCSDQNECALDLFNCSNRAVCVNTVGSYECVCPEGSSGDNCSICGSGYDLNGNGTCVDLNECDLIAERCTFSCNNLPGSYSCQESMLF